MKRIVLWLTLAAILAVAYGLYSSRSKTDLDVTPEAKQEIEKAMRR